MITLADRYEKVCQELAASAMTVGKSVEEIRMVAVSKYVDIAAIRGLTALGHRDFGESRIQQAREKISAEPGLHWHMIGRIQTNKIKYLKPYHLIQSLDRLDLARALSEWAEIHDHSFNCLVQVNVSQDTAKAGIALSSLNGFLEQAALPGLNIRGLMTITALDAGPDQTWEWYNQLAESFITLKGQNLPPGVNMEWLSMGMSADFPLAIRAGANMIRIGSSIFSQEE